MSYREREMSIPEPAPIEKRHTRYPGLEQLINPDYGPQIKTTLLQVQNGSLGVEVAHASIMQMLIETAAKDTMTGLNKADAVKIKLSRLMEYSRDNNIPLSVVYMDGDNFKMINDKINHATGDKVILTIAEAVNKATRTSDIQGRLREDIAKQPHSEEDDPHARMGGDEFILVLPGATAEEALIVLERFTGYLTELAAINTPECQTQLGVPITVSAGIAQYDPSRDLNPNDLINRSEASMKQAKNEGNGLVKIAEPVGQPA